MTDETAKPRGPLDMLEVLGRTEGRLDEHSRLMEIYTLEGLLSIWWFGAPGATDVVLMVGGAAGGVPGPGGALYLELGRSMAGSGRPAMSIDYRRPGDVDRCLLDVAATLPDHTVGIITYSTQSAGCEDASQLGDIPLLLLHGERDSILGPENSRMVQMLAGHGEVQTFPGADHLLAEVADELSEITHRWVVEQFTRHAGSTA